MSEYVFSHADVLIADGHFHARLNRGDAWWADDPVVAAYPHYFSRYPLVVLSTAGRPAPGLSLVSEPLPAPVATVPVVDDAQRAVAATNALAETNPVIASVVESATVRRGPGRPRRG